MPLPERNLLSLLGCLVFAALIVPPASAARALSQPSASQTQVSGLTATLDGQPLDPIEASLYYCHTRDYPIVRCFSDPAGLEKDLGFDPGASPDGAYLAPLAADSSSPYTTAYMDANYGGTYIVLYSDVTNLAPIGWSDDISSVKSIYCGLPAYYTDTSYGGYVWEDTCNTGSPNLYTYDNTFSSVRNLA